MDENNRYLSKKLSELIFDFLEENNIKFCKRYNPLIKVSLPENNELKLNLLKGITTLLNSNYYDNDILVNDIIKLYDNYK